MSDRGASVCGGVFGFGGACGIRTDGDSRADGDSRGCNASLEVAVAIGRLASLDPPRAPEPLAPEPLPEPLLEGADGSLGEVLGDFAFKKSTSLRGGGALTTRSWTDLASLCAIFSNVLNSSNEPPKTSRSSIILRRMSVGERLTSPRRVLLDTASATSSMNRTVLVGSSEPSRPGTSNDVDAASSRSRSSQWRIMLSPSSTSSAAVHDGDHPSPHGSSGSSCLSRLKILTKAM